ncbi:MAG: flagellar hook-associated protein FlgL [Candidatus Latescibacterota bacterium]
MRVTSQMAVGTLVGNLGRSYERIVRFQGELSSGRRLNTLSDDPAAVERSLALRSELRNIEQFQKNIDDGVGWLGLSEATLNELEGLFVEVRGLAVQGATSTYNAAQRSAIADQVDQYLEHVLSLTEARYRGRYIFSGTRTGTVPYVAERDANGNILGVSASGDLGGAVEREIADRVTMQVNVPGPDVFASPREVVISLGTLAEGLEAQDAERLRQLFGDDGRMTLVELDEVLAPPAANPPMGDGLRQVLVQVRDQYAARDTNPFAALIELRDALRANDAEGVRGTLSKLAVVRERISAVRGLVGARANRMETTRNVLDRVSVEMTSILSDDEDVDLAATIVSLQQEQDVFQAALASGTSVVPQSLMDFI